MTFTYHELKTKTVAELRKIAAGLQSEAVKGYTQLNKEHLLIALCNALKIDPHEHHQTIMQNKIRIKRQIHELKTLRDEAIAAGDHTKLAHLRGRIHSLKKHLRHSMI